jgi:hypothetical protein
MAMLPCTTVKMDQRFVLQTISKRTTFLIIMKQVCKLLLPNGGTVGDLFMDYRNRLLTFGCDFRENPELLVWQMNEEGKFTLGHQESLERSRGEIQNVEMDDQYVAITVQNDPKIFIYFFSMSTMKIEGSLRDIPLQGSYAYRSGLLFNLRNGYIR